MFIVQIYAPGETVPTRGQIEMGALGGMANSKEVGPTGKTSPVPILMGHVIGNCLGEILFGQFIEAVINIVLYNYAR